MIRIDPEQNEVGALFDLVELDGRRVLEIGSGDGRLMWRYVDKTRNVTAVEPFPPSVARAEANLSKQLVDQVTLCQATFGEFAATKASSAYDVAILSWSLCCMNQEDMVPALEEAHRLLTPDGTLIDIHPISGTAEIEIHRAGEIVFAEPASTSPDDGASHADEALAHVVADGLFVAERKAEFDFRAYATSIRELRDFLAEADAHSNDVDGEPEDAYSSEIYERVGRIATHRGDEVAYHERAQITRLIPLPT